MNPIVKLKLNSDGPNDLQELTNQVEQGARFICFQYCISILFAVTLRRYSPAILVQQDDRIDSIRRKYNLMSVFFGWWGIPWGPIYTVRSLRLNRIGGIDITEDILLNINESSLVNKEVELKVTSQIFCSPDKWNLKAYRSCLSPILKQEHVKSVVVGVYINTAEGETPIQTIGIEVPEAYFESCIEIAERNLSREFNKHVVFQFLNLEKETELNSKLKQQGVTIK
ncbi:hypothetical protein [Mangrovibacterium diazotrophicum]|nr:hypothetical protein [Mangrovibacterium diazotrophicum]